jgi:predicted solute-binding protein
VKILIRLGTVSFLNSKPLTFALEEKIVESDFEVIATPPADLSRKLYKKEIDLGLIPVAELLKRKSYSVLPDISISSNGKVDSVILLSKGELKDVSSVAVDRRSQSSTALLRIILEIFYNLSPVYEPRDISNGFFNGVDGGMLIGDAGLETMYSPPNGYRVYDLGEIWTEQTGLPFVYAVFAVNRGVKLGRNLEALYESKAYGLGTLRKIAKLESRKIGLSEEICFKYLSDRIRYDFGENEVAGIVRYSELLSELGECDKITGVNIYPA